jgi:hypothetical protein
MQFDIFKILFIFIKDSNCKDMFWIFLNYIKDIKFCTKLKTWIIFMFLATYIFVGNFKLKM